MLWVSGCEFVPINRSDPAAALRLKAYVWPEAAARMGRIEAAIQLAGELALDVVEKDAGEFVAGMLLRRQVDGTTRAMFHSIMWQYMPAATQDAITALFEEVGAKATRDRPLAWVSLETNPETFRHELHVRYWDGTQGAGEAHLLAFAHPHGEWVQWGDLES